ncbi:MAG: 50S ribosomal protein L11 methyltransferase [Pseudomonadota bacterium]
MTAAAANATDALMVAVAAAAHRHIATTRHRLTPEMLYAALSQEFQTDRRTIRRAVAKLVQTGLAQYTYEFGCSFLVPSFNRPVTVSPRVVLCPSGFPVSPAAGQVWVTLDQGAAFGTGAHPTTRLAVRGIDSALTPFPTSWRPGQCRVLDVGTGSGVLLLTALSLGMHAGIGLDVDPCAVSEARANATLNGLQRRSVFTDTAITRIDGHFQLVTANLRFPTLADLTGTLSVMTSEDGLLVVSGIREAEAGALASVYGQAGWKVLWQEAEGGWAGQVYRRR